MNVPSLKIANSHYRENRYNEALLIYQELAIHEKELSAKAALEFNIRLCRKKVSGTIGLPKLSNKSSIEPLAKSYLQVQDMHGKSINLHPWPCYQSNEYQIPANCHDGSYVVGATPFSAAKLNDLDIALHIHLHYVELLDEFIEYLKNFPCKISLYVSINDKAHLRHVNTKIGNSLPELKTSIKILPNKGRDIGPMLLGFRDELRKHEIIGHIHSKKSPHNILKSDWRRQLLESLIGSADIVGTIMDLFANNSHIGMIFPSYHHSLEGQISWGNNYDQCKKLSEKLNIKITPDNMVLFPAGSMFWSRTESILPLLNFKFKDSDFQDELGQIDGTTAHAIERLFGELCVQQGFQLLQVKSVKQFNLKKYFNTEYNYTHNEVDFSSLVLNYNSRKKLNNKIVVYTAVTGGYEELPQFLDLDPDIDYVAYTDQPICNQGFWDIKAIDYWHPDPVRMARRIKVNPHVYVKDYEIAIWLDANVIIEKPLSQHINAFKNSPMVIGGINHPLRSCVYDEASILLKRKKDTSHRINRQVSALKTRGFPKNAGLIETNLMFFKLQSELVHKFCNVWWSEICKYSHRDQLSVNYSAHSLGLKFYEIMDERRSLRDHSDFAYLGHGSNSGFKPKMQVGSVINPLSKNSDTNSSPMGCNFQKIDVVVCVHNALEDVILCLDSVCVIKEMVNKLIIVNDGSNNETTNYLRSFEREKNGEFSINLVENSTALGYCRAANLGMRMVKANAFLLLNSDTIVNKASIANMIDLLFQHEKTGIVGPLSNAASTQSVPYITNTEFQTAVNELPKGYTIDDMQNLCQKISNPSLMPTTQLVHGFCQLIKDTVYKAIKGFDEEAFPNGYGEENDFCLRAIDAGFDCKICTSAFIYHKKSASYTDDKVRLKLMKNGAEQLRRKHGHDRVDQAIKIMECHPILTSIRKKVITECFAES